VKFNATLSTKTNAKCFFLDRYLVFQTLTYHYAFFKETWSWKTHAFLKKHRQQKRIPPCVFQSYIVNKNAYTTLRFSQPLGIWFILIRKSYFDIRSFGQMSFGQMPFSQHILVTLVGQNVRISNVIMN
jgi:hypothetical protein